MAFGFQKAKRCRASRQAEPWPQPLTRHQTRPSRPPSMFASTAQQRREVSLVEALGHGNPALLPFREYQTQASG
jgi:hypothetical protein